LHCFFSPFDPNAIEFLETLDAPAYKIDSFELVDTPLIRRVAALNKPIIMSTGIANLAEIEDACADARHTDAGFALLHCISSYPAKPEEMRLGTIEMLARTFGVPIGLSDHTLGSAVAVASIAPGTCIIEKHITLARADGGPDAGFSLEPDEFKQLVADCRMAHAALGSAQTNREGVGGSNAQFRRSLYVVADVKAGDILGKPAARDLQRGEPFDWGMIKQ
jgi:N-acetylneuraminate synthase